MKSNVKALTSFVHGRVKMEEGDEHEFTKAEADELFKAGLVMHVTYEQEAEKSAFADEDVGDLLGEGEQKMDDAPENKMEAAPKNKAEPKAKAK